MAKKHPKSVH